MLDVERQYLEERQGDLVRSYSGKYIVVKDRELIGAYETFDEALQDGTKRFGLDSFLVRRVGETIQEISIPAFALGILRGNPSQPDNR